MENSTYKDTHNYCRNHGLSKHEDGGAPWCFTNNKDIMWETCDIKICNNTKAIEFLIKYGYLNKQIPKVRHKKSSNKESASYLMVDGKLDRQTRDALLDFQSFSGINKTGVFDKETLKMMAMPRCGVKDRLGDETENDYYVLQGSWWLRNFLTYKIKKYPSPSHPYRRQITNKDVDNSIREAMNIWEAVTNLKFITRDVGRVDIDISFEKGEHGDNHPFDGPASASLFDNQVAHAFFPDADLTGDIHVDDTEDWTVKSYKGIDLLFMFTHELGHSLGLRHSAEMNSIMAPKYRWYNPNLKLHEDDIKAIQSLYGKKKYGTCASGLFFSWFKITCKIKRDDCTAGNANNLHFKFSKFKCGCQCCDMLGCGPKNFDN